MTIASIPTQTGRCHERASIFRASADMDGAPKAAGGVRGIAYTGDRVHPWFEGGVVVDLTGIVIPTDERLPILYEHGADESGQWKNAGYTTGITNTGEQIGIDGVLIDNDTGRKIAADGRAGFPWELSISFDPEESEFIEEGEQVAVNGRVFVGPFVHVTKSRLREVSFVHQGADANTSTETFNRGGKPPKETSMADNPVETPTEQEEREVVAVEDLTAEYLSENMPEVVEEAAKMLADEEPEADESEMAEAEDEKPVPTAQSASLAEIRALDGADGDFAIAMFSAGATLDIAKAALSEASRLSIGSSVEAETPVPSSQSKPEANANVVTDVDEIWDEDINGVRKHFTKLCSGDEVQGERSFRRFAATQRSLGRPYDRLS